jgi:anthranilate synthase component 2
MIDFDRYHEKIYHIQKSTKMKILVLDNYDSFTYNLVQYIQEIMGHKVDVIRNDAITVEAVDAYDTIILSPGPGLPKDAGIMPELIKKYATTKNILGVCLGHQAIGEAYGGELHNLERVYHGIETPMYVTDADEVLLQNVSKEVMAGRNNTCVVKKEEFPSDLKVTAMDIDGVVMACRHKEHNVRGVQFHPESVMTPEGKQMLRNFLEYSQRLALV